MTTETLLPMQPQAGQPESGPRPRPRRIAVSGRMRAYALLLVFLGAGAALRFADIGRTGFWADELLHVFAARSYLDEGRLDVPMKGSYDRAFPVTWLTAVSFRLFGESEAAARIPFALANLGFIVTAFFVLQRLFSLRLALIFAALAAFSPFEIVMSRECRMYTFFQWAFFAAAVATMVGLEPRKEKPRARTQLRVPYLALGVALLGISSIFHELTINFGFIVVSYAALMFGWVACQQGLRSAVYSRYGLILGLAVLGFVGMVIKDEEYVRTMYSRARSLQDWQLSKGFDENFYRYLYLNALPGLVFIYPMGAFLLAKRYGRRGAFVVAAFVPLMLLHSFFFARKSDRYVFYLLPFFLIGAAAALELIWEMVSRQWRRFRWGEPGWLRVAAVAAALPAINLVAYPWIYQASEIYSTARFADWKTIPESLRADIRQGTLITLTPRDVVYYIGRYPDAYRITEVSKSHRYEPGMINHHLDLKRVVESSSNVYFVTIDWNMHNDAYMTDTMRTYIRTNFTKIKHPGDPRILVYHKA